VELSPNRHIILAHVFFYGSYGKVPLNLLLVHNPIAYKLDDVRAESLEDNLILVVLIRIFHIGIQLGARLFPSYRPKFGFLNMLYNELY
jgi:hypothetical protein